MYICLPLSFLNHLSELDLDFCVQNANLFHPDSKLSRQQCNTIKLYVHKGAHNTRSCVRQVKNVRCSSIHFFENFSWQITIEYVEVLTICFNKAFFSVSESFTLFMQRIVLKHRDVFYTLYHSSSLNERLCRTQFPRTKCPPIHRRCFRLHFREWRVLYFV